MKKVISQRIPSGQPKALAYRLERELQDCFEQLNVTGPIRRRLQYCDSIEFVAIPIMYESGALLKAYADKDKRMEIVSPNSFAYQLTKSYWIKCKIHYADIERFYTDLWVTTGPQDMIVDCTINRSDNGLLDNKFYYDNGFYYAVDDIIPVMSDVITHKAGELAYISNEETIFTMCGLDYIHPDNRHNWKHYIKLMSQIS